MNYNILADLAVFGLFLMALGVTIVVMERKARRYATEADRKDVINHQHERRIRMADGDYR